MADVTFVTNVDLANNELRNAKAQVLSADPTGVEGKFIYNSTDKQLKFYDGTAWVSGGAQLGNLSGQAAAFGQSAANGSAVTAARSDHYHALPAHDNAAHSAIKLNALTVPDGAVAMNGQKLTGLGNGTASGDAMHYGQIVGTYAPLANPGFSGTVVAPTFAVSGVNGAQSMFLLGPDTQSSVNVIRVPPLNNDHHGFELKVGNDIASPVLSLRAISHSNGTVGTLSFVDNGSGEIHMNKKLLMNSNKITGVTAGAATGEVVTYEQVVGVYQPIDGDLTAIAALATTGYARRTGTDAWTIDSSIPQASVTSLTADLNLKAPLASPALTGTPTAPTPAAGDNSTKIATTAYVDAATSAAAAGLDFKQSVRLATTTNINLSSFGTGNVDGIGTVAGQRVLVKNQTNKAENGIYTVGGSAWTRATDFDSSTEVTAGAFVFVEEGTTQADTGWVLTTDGAITVGTTQLDFTQFSGVGSWTWGNGLSNTLNTVNVGAGTGISVAADTVGIDTSVVPRKYSTTLSGTAASQTVTHNLGTQDVVVSVRRTADNVVVYTGVTAATTNTVTIDFATTVTANAYRVTVMA